MALWGTNASCMDEIWPTIFTSRHILDNWDFPDSRVGHQWKVRIGNIGQRWEPCGALDNCDSD